MIARERHGDIEVVRLEHGKVNELDVELLRAIGACFDELAASDARAVVLTGTRKVFSAGADLIRVLDEGESYVRESLPVLSAAFLSVFAFPRPVVAAINGHAIAGGAVFALACDHRIMSGGTFGLAELRVGVPFPVAALEIVRYAIGAKGLQEAVYFGENYPAAEAWRRSLVDELVDPEALMARALEEAERLATIPAASFSHVKAQLRRPVLERIERDAPEHDPDAAQIWHSPDARAAIHRFLDDLARR
jgi:enoyl-CoA hydratase